MPRLLLDWQSSWLYLSFCHVSDKNVLGEYKKETPPHFQRFSCAKRHFLKLSLVFDLEFKQVF